MNSELPFAGLRVLDFGTVIAGPFAGALMADMGAEVIKIEPPNAPDALRKMGRMKEGVPLWFGVSARDKQCLSLNLKEDEAKDILRKMIAQSDVMIENYRPGVLERLGLGWEQLRQLNPNLIMLSISGFGQTGPDSIRPGFGKIGEGMAGIVNMTGPGDDRPLVVGFSLADTCAGLFGVFGVSVALYNRDVLKQGGTRIDVALYEPLLRMLEAQFIMHDRTGKPTQRRGSFDPYGWGQDPAARPQFHGLRGKSGDWFLLRADAATIGKILGTQPATRADAYKALAAWAVALDDDALRQGAMAAGADIVPVLDGMGVGTSAYFQARGDILRTTHPKAGTFSVPGPVYPRLAANDGREIFREREVGGDNEAVLTSLLGMSAADVASLKSRGVI